MTGSFIVALLTVCLSIAIVPFFIVGIIGKTKAFLQNRKGAPLLQPLFDFQKLLNKEEVISNDASWIYLSSCLTNLTVMLVLAISVPWLIPEQLFFSCDLYCFIYLLAIIRLSTVLLALDSGSSFGGFGASREATIGFLVEPAIILALSSLAANAGTSNLFQIFSIQNISTYSNFSITLWLLAGLCMFSASLIELNRMPIDDPTTHLELTMIHEAMILENSGRNLALIEYAHYLKITILYGFCAQCFIQSLLHSNLLSSVFGFFPNFGQFIYVLLSLGTMFVLAILTAFLETFWIKLRWTKVPEFIAYAITFAILCAMTVASANAGGGS